MKDVIDFYWQLRTRAKETNSDVAKALSIAEDDLPASYFNMVFNNITLIIELLVHSTVYRSLPLPLSSVHF